MALPPWSPSSLDTFVNCGKQYYHKYVAKDLPYEPPTVEQATGTAVHKAFEDYVNEDAELPPHLEMHKPFLDRLMARAGVHWCEERVALTKTMRPVTWHPKQEAPEPLFWRGVIDFRKVDAEDPRATIVDYKTGKPHQKFTQLSEYAIHTFLLFPNVELVDARFYWTQTMTVTRKVWARHEMDAIWADILPDLQQMKQAYATNTWQERPSGLCNGWCPVKKCQHWRPKRR